MFYTLAIVTAILFLIIDQITKYIVISNMQLYDTIPFINGIMDFTYIHNTGGAWGILNKHTWILVVFTLLAMAICVFVLIKYARANKILFFALCLIIAGGTGNMIDRIFRGGKVIDFLEVTFIDFPIFNIADCAVCIGAGLLLLYFTVDLIKERKEKRAKGL
ncbi:MAG: signal peptidase II [Clostridia bacterium]|nr:signal peptidase II [Clostridia bacterium]